MYPHLTLLMTYRRPFFALLDLFQTNAPEPPFEFKCATSVERDAFLTLLRPHISFLESKRLFAPEFFDEALLEEEPDCEAAAEVTKKVASLEPAPVSSSAPEALIDDHQEQLDLYHAMVTDGATVTSESHARLMH
jgi:hypothetical protein